MDTQEETTDTPGRQLWIKGPKHNPAATSEEKDDNQQWHQKTKQKTGNTSQKCDDM
jgi:hypothetical protein